MKVISLRKTLVYVIMTGYVALLILLSGMDYYLMAEYQERREEQKVAALEDYRDGVSQRMESVRRTLYSIGTTDRDFAALTGEQSEAENYGNAYELCETLENQMLLEDKLQGFYLFYDTMEVPMYKVDIGKIPAEHASRIGSTLKMDCSVEAKSRISPWFHLTIDDSVYLAISYRRKNCVLYGVLALGDAGAKIGTTLGRDAKIVICTSGRVESNAELAEKLGILDAVREGDERISLRADGHSVCGTKLSGTDVWICPVFENGWRDYVTVWQMFLLALTACSFLLVIWMVGFVNRQLIRPLKDLRVELDHIRRGVRKNVPEMDVCFLELREMLDTLQEMIEQLEKQRLLTYEEFIEKQKAQLQYLQLQLQPHFYLNSLKMLNALAAEGEKERLQTVILRLSEHMRYLLLAERETTLLGKELDFVKNYVKLQNEMKSREIVLETEVEEELLGWEVPMLALQTFVENSVKYAKLGNSKEILRIWIDIHMLETEDGRFMDIQISDNGQGYAGDVLENINGEAKAGESHVGIQNLKRRCQILYGEKAEFSFASLNGAVSECIIPGEETAR